MTSYVRSITAQDPQVTVVIPNYNGIEYLGNCLDALLSGTMPVRIIVVDNASTDGSFELVRDAYPGVLLLRLKDNTGFCHACNSGLRITTTPYVILLNNDTRPAPDFAEQLYTCILQRSKCFSVQARMRSMKDPSVLDGAGDQYCALGWAFARGKAAPFDSYDKPGEIFSACAGAAIYRRSVFDEIGYLDERHFCYLEDVDLGWRARIYGYYNYYWPAAVTEHAGSATSGAVYSVFKERMAAGNNRYMIYKNMPAFQYWINAPLIALGTAVKRAFFRRKGLGDAFDEGLMRGSCLIDLARYEDKQRALDSPEKGSIQRESMTELFEEPLSPEERAKRPLIHPLYLGGKLPFKISHLWNYVRIQGLLWKNIPERFKGLR